MAHIVILGGGFGGITVATTLSDSLDADHRISLVDRRSEFMMGLRKLWILTGGGTRQAGSRPLAALAERGIQVHQDEVRAIDPARRRVETSTQVLEADFLVVALGAELDPYRIPGFRDFNLYDPTASERAAGRVAGLRAGRILVGILGLPYKCPPAPYEACFLLDEMLRASGVRERIGLDVFTPQPLALPVAGAEASARLSAALLAKGIGFHPKFNATRVDPGQVAAEDGRRLEFDILLGVPPHRCPAVVVAGGLTGGGTWVTPDPQTLETRFARVYAIGDVTQIPVGGGQMVPKAGVLAEAEGRVVAGRILAAIEGGEAPTFDGQGYCFLEMGDGQAAAIRGRFYAEGGPEMAMEEPSPEALREKRAFEADRLAAWFGDRPEPAT
jgi:sulfide:quinone oxidoreductase